MKLRTKLVLGFAAVILVMVALGATAFVMFKRVDSNIAAVNRELPAVRYATGVERSALEAILEEKNYLLFKTPDIYARAKGKLNQLVSNLDEIDKLAQTTHNTELTSRSSGVRKATSDYGKLYDQAVDRPSRRTRPKRPSWIKRANIVSEEAAALLKTKKVEVPASEQRSGGYQQRQCLGVGHAVERKDLHAQPRTDGTHCHRAQCHQPLGRLRRPGKAEPGRDRKKQIANARKATQDYAKALEAWIAEYKRDAKSAALVDFLKTMNRSGDMVSQMVDDYILTKQAVFEKIVESMFIVTGISQEALGARFSEKAYIIERNLNDWETLNLQVQELPKLYASLRKVALTADDKNRIDRASQGHRRISRGSQCLG